MFICHIYQILTGTITFVFANVPEKVYIYILQGELHSEGEKYRQGYLPSWLFPFPPHYLLWEGTGLWMHRHPDLLLPYSFQTADSITCYFIVHFGILFALLLIALRSLHHFCCFRRVFIVVFIVQLNLWTFIWLNPGVYAINTPESDQAVFK